MQHDTIFRTGIIGTIIAAICCFTPILVIAFGVFGLSAWLGWIDYVLIPLLLLFIALALYGYRQRNRARTCCDTDTQPAPRKQDSRKGE
ncbi:mercury resistance system transport protein MerF [Thalassospira xiamenensis]|uniref:Mercuric ion transport protein n=1 Tax=Thalassospira xiamenensis TaxID=220697 RepID=A0A285TZJ4_9PROT|nr:mercury resistance system transport protein MerF [Thalassospira xiamenensis]SOC31027.1 mercuric ion transport protein [Thalassospira xiamenensis]